ncbi:hypothetical protein [Deinococcus maricopensis]|uniref:Lipoprotein n=1 Tax=Deinococcus maricopensis (strain DSM 21211 / LMG 22137 / NRRL B-23946 / LB-34) TaxID=709986 RepID=E8U3V1_DEIML|nr:hypothetical protein [Deinococcus maricopensis]ADV68794.1 hypothetical protein Deima_3166 [Deinococcus maricopensis DSM 21211]
MKNLLPPLSLALALAACSPTPAPAPAPAPAEPPPAATYPYNPSASAQESADPRIPYAGEWVWLAVFKDGTTQYGKMNVDERFAPVDKFTNIGSAWNVLCVDADTCPTTPYGQDEAIIATYTDAGKSFLAVTGYAAASDSPQFGIFDEDGVVTVEDGHAWIEGTGVWADDREIGFAMMQVHAGLSATSTGKTSVGALKVAPTIRNVHAQGTASLTAKAVQLLKNTF